MCMHFSSSRAVLRQKLTLMDLLYAVHTIVAIHSPLLLIEQLTSHTANNVIAVPCSGGPLLLQIP